jgi:hypothetical protein
MRGFIEAFCACDIERFLDAAIALTGSDPTVCANQVVGTLIQIKQECRWSRSLSAGAGVARWRGASPLEQADVRQSKSSRSSGDGREGR